MKADTRVILNSVPVKPRSHNYLLKHHTQKYSLFFRQLMAFTQDKDLIASCYNIPDFLEVNKHDLDQGVQREKERIALKDDYKRRQQAAKSWAAGENRRRQLERDKIEAATSDAAFAELFTPSVKEG